MYIRHPHLLRALLIGSAIRFAGMLAAQNNAIFQGGNADGYASGGIAQQVSTAGIFSGGNADGYGRSGFAQTITTPGIFAGGTADGYARSGFAQPISTSGIFSGGSADGYSRGGFAQVSSTTGIFSGGLGDGYARANGSNIKVAIQGIALLEGPWNAGAQLMNDNLRSAGLVPLSEPYTALGYPSPGGGGESTTPGTLAQTGAAAVVDWVRVELRDAATPHLLVAASHALLIRTGGIVDPVTTDDFIGLSAPAGDYYVVVRHRNHLGVMTAAPIALSATATEIDFSNTTTATFGTAAQKTIGSVNVLWAGDVTGNHQLKYTGSGNDRDPILVSVGSTTPNNILIGQYDRRDVNMDGTVKYTGAGNDRDPILVNVGSTTPNNTRTEQVP